MCLIKGALVGEKNFDEYICISYYIVNTTGMNHLKKLLIFYDNIRMKIKSVILIVKEKDTENGEG